MISLHVSPFHVRSRCRLKRVLSRNWRGNAAGSPRSDRQSENTSEDVGTALRIGGASNLAVEAARRSCDPTARKGIPIPCGSDAAIPFSRIQLYSRPGLEPGPMTRGVHRCATLGTEAVDGNDGDYGSRLKAGMTSEHPPLPARRIDHADQGIADDDQEKARAEFARRNHRPAVLLRWIEPCPGEVPTFSDTEPSQTRSRNTSAKSIVSSNTRLDD